MRRILWTALLVSGLSLLTACGGASFAGAMPEAAADRAPGGAAMAEPAPAAPSAGESMADDFRADREETKDEGRVASAGPVPGPTTTPQPATTGTTGTAPPATAPTSTSGTQPPGPSMVSAVRAPLLIYTAQITMAVFEVNAALAQIEDMSRELGGFLARRDDASITIRVPVAVFDTAIKRIEKSGDMLHRNVTAQDVTEEFRDLEVRIRNARAVRDRLEQLLAKASKVEESVVVERELERVTGEIERMEGRIKFLRDRAAFSTITVSFQPKAKEELSQTPFRLPVPWLNDLGLSRLLRL